MTESTDVPRSPPGGGWKLADDRNEGIGWSSSWHIKVLHAWYDCKPLSTLLPLEPFPQIKLPPLETVKSERYLVMLVLLNWTRRPSLVINCLFSLRQIGSWGSFSLEVIGHSFYLRFSHISLPPRILLNQACFKARSRKKTIYCDHFVWEHLLEMFTRSYMIGGSLSWLGFLPLSSFPAQGNTIFEHSSTIHSDCSYCSGWSLGPWWRWRRRRRRRRRIT